MWIRSRHVLQTDKNTRRHGTSAGTWTTCATPAPQTKSGGRPSLRPGRVRRKGSAGVARFFPTRLPNPNSISYRLPGVGRHCADNRGGIKGDAWASAGFSGHSDSEPRFRDNHLPQVGRVTAPPDAPQPMPCRATGFPPGDAACGGRGPRFLDEPCAC